MEDVAFVAEWPGAPPGPGGPAGMAPGVASLEQNEEISVSGIVRLPPGAPPLDGLMIVTIEDVSMADSLAPVVFERRTAVRQADWVLDQRYRMIPFDFRCTMPERRSHSLAISARLHAGDADRLCKGDALTVKAYPLPETGDVRVTLDLIAI